MHCLGKACSGWDEGAARHRRPPRAVAASGSEPAAALHRAGGRRCCPTRPPLRPTLWPEQTQQNRPLNGRVQLGRRANRPDQLGSAPGAAGARAGVAAASTMLRQVAKRAAQVRRPGRWRVPRRAWRTIQASAGPRRSCREWRWSYATPWQGCWAAAWPPAHRSQLPLRPALPGRQRRPVPGPLVLLAVTGVHGGCERQQGEAEGGRSRAAGAARRGGRARCAPGSGGCALS